MHEHFSRAFVSHLQDALHLHMTSLADLLFLQQLRTSMLLHVTSFSDGEENHQCRNENSFLQRRG